jgi:hypothetical protein
LVVFLSLQGYRMFILIFQLLASRKYMINFEFLIEVKIFRIKLPSKMLFSSFLLFMLTFCIKKTKYFSFIHLKGFIIGPQNISKSTCRFLIYWLSFKRFVLFLQNFFISKIIFRFFRNIFLIKVLKLISIFIF